MKNYFSTNLKYLRNNANMTQADLAKKIGKDYSTIGKWELGQRHPVMVDLIKIADIFNVEAQDFIEKDFRLKQEKKEDEIVLLLKKNINILTKDDKDYIRFIIEKRKNVKKRKAFDK